MDGYEIYHKKRRENRNDYVQLDKLEIIRLKVFEKEQKITLQLNA